MARRDPANMRFQPDAASIFSAGGELTLVLETGGSPAAVAPPDVLRVLVVEDDEEDFILVRDLLRHSGAVVEVEGANTVESALAKARQQNFDVCLCDYRLGARTGLDLLREFRNQPPLPPVIFLTGQGDEQVAVQAMKAGAVDYLLKSRLTGGMLARALGYCVELRRKEEAVRQARAEILSSEQRFRALVEHSSDAVGLLDAEGAVLYASQSVKHLLGYAPEAILGKNVREFVHPDDWGPTQQILRVALRHPGAVLRIEFRCLHQDGQWRHTEGTAVNRLPEPAVHGVVINIRDISQRKRAEMHLQEAHEAMRALYQASPLAIVAVDREGLVTSVNQATERMFGWQECELTGRALPLPEDREAAHRELLARALNGELVLGLEARSRRKDGAPIEISVSMGPLHDAAGRVTGAVSVIADIGEQKRAERELRASEERYRLLFEQNLAGVIRTTVEGQISECNDALARMLGFGSREEALGQNIRDLYQKPEDRERMLEGLQTAGNLLNFEFHMRRRDGVNVCMLANVGLQRDEAGRPQFVEGTVLDITERRALEEQLLQARKMEAVGQLAGGVAHDFNNLLMIMSSYAELLADGATGDSKLRHSADEIIKAARRATVLTRQLLAFSRKQVLSPQVLNLNTVLEELCKLLPRLIGENIEIKLRLEAQLWKVRADPTQIEQVVMNLAANARDAMPQGGSLTLETANARLDDSYGRQHAGATGDYVLLSVSDTGRGIAPEVLPHIFEPFFTTKEKGKGTGLGLPTVYGIVKQSGGYVWAYSEVNHGTVFKIYLPRERTAKDAPEPEVKKPDTAAAMGAETILLVEDEDALREGAAQFLSLRGYKVLQGRNGMDALRMAELCQGNLDLLITDVVMPGMGGRELADRLRKIRPQTRVLYISGYTESTVLQQGVELGFGFLQKPFTLNALSRKVRELLDAMPAAEPVGAGLANKAE